MYIPIWLYGVRRAIEIGSVMKSILSLFLVLCGLSVQAETVHWIDVRTSFEYRLGNIEGAVNIPYDVIGDEISGITSDKNAQIRLYCRSGNRSGKALITLQQMGYTQATNEGGYSSIIEKTKAQ